MHLVRSMKKFYHFKLGMSLLLSLIFLPACGEDSVLGACEVATQTSMGLKRYESLLKHLKEQQDQGKLTPEYRAQAFETLHEGLKPGAYSETFRQKFTDYVCNSEINQTAPDSGSSSKRGA